MNKRNISTILEQIPHILIVDDEPELCSILEEFITILEFKPESINNPLDVAHRIGRRFYNVVLLDVRMPNKSGIELIPEIKKQSPDTKIIIMSGYAEKKTAIKALRLGAFDFLEKPFEREILSHAVKRALDVQKTELGFRQAYEELKRGREELLANQSKLKEVNRQLMETNNALSVLAQNIDRTRMETEAQIVTRIRSSIMPLIEKFKKSRHLEEFRVDLGVLMDFMDDLLAGLSAEPEIARVLSTTEFRVAALIKNGLTTDEIANHMYVAPCTVKAHRRNIRKKLSLDHSGRNLTTYLQSKGLGKNNFPESAPRFG
jgi:FixJ family two-component response regulator